MTIKYKRLQIAALSLTIAGFSLTGIATLARQSDQQTQPDNARNNKGDNGKVGTTADQQQNNLADRELAKKKFANPSPAILHSPLAHTTLKSSCATAWLL
jgi:hypothetical protein